MAQQSNDGPTGSPRSETDGTPFKDAERPAGIEPQGPHFEPPKPPDDEPAKRKGVLDAIEWLGNKLPDPATLFLLGALLVMALSWVGHTQGWTVEKPVVVPVTEPVLNARGEPVTINTFEPAGRSNRLVTTTDDGGNTIPADVPVTSAQYRVIEQDDGTTAAVLRTQESTETVVPRNLVSRDGVNWIFQNMVGNFTGFHPLGVVLVAMLGIGVAEKTGAIGALLRVMMLFTPMRMLTPAMVFIGVMSSMAADAGYVVLPPLAAALYKAVGRSPLVGLAAVFAGVSAGFSANLLPTGIDPLLAGLTQEGAQILDPGYTVNPLCNYYFMIVSTILLTFVGWFVTAVFVEPRFEKKPPEAGGPSPLTREDEDAQKIDRTEIRGLWWSLAWTALFTGLAAMLIVIPGAPLYAGEGEPARWPNAIVPLLFILFLVPGIAYGLATGTLKEETGEDKADVAVGKLMARSMADMGPYIVLAFFAAQFVEFFNHSNLGLMLAIVGGEALQAADLPAPLLLALFIIVAGLGNLFIGSASAKYAFFAPVFVPMFMQIGISPELTQVAYRVGDSITNIIAPLNVYLIVILVFMRKYVPKAGLGSLIALMLPYTVVFWIVWTIVLVTWMLVGAPLGPDGGLEYVGEAATG
jgi:aminobenzoyl-glutamate transport protein